MLVDEIKVIDVDTHIIEPYDLWTARVSTRKYGDKVPHVRWDEEKRHEAWYFGSDYVAPAAAPAMAGWKDFPPVWPTRLEEVQQSTWSGDARLKSMDDHGIHTQLLYPNVAGFGAGRYLTLGDRGLMLECIRAYNDWLAEWSSVAPGRFVPLMALPFWDLEASLKEMVRAAKLGHKGVVACTEPDFFGFPKLSNRHWDPLWAQAEDMGLPINFHIGAGSDWAMNVVDAEAAGTHAAFSAIGTMFFVQNASSILQIICGGICHRFPRLNFVSVESGVGWLPFLLEAMDWQWRNSGVPGEHPDYLLPSEYFQRQIYGCFWFEGASLDKALELLGPDNLMFETDFPHPTSMSPGPASVAQVPADYIEQRFSAMPRDVATKLLRGNAARIYNLS